MQQRWLISALCLVILGSALLADAQTSIYHPASAQPPNQFQVIRSVGQASDDSSVNYGGQSQIWLNVQPPINTGNSAVPTDYGVDVSPITTVAAKFSCTDITGLACAGSNSAGAAYPTSFSPASGVQNTFDIVVKAYIDGPGGGQNFQQNTAYTFSAYTVNVYGEGSRVSAPSIRLAWSGTPKAPSALAYSYLSPTSFVLTWTPPQDIGQAKPSGYVLVTPFYNVQIRLVSATLAGGTLQWYNQDTTISANAFSATTGFHNEQSVVQTYANPGGTITKVMLSPKVTYQVRVRAVGQWGFGIWSSPLSVTTPDSLQSPNALLGNPVAQSVSGVGGLVTFSTNTSALTNGNENIIGRGAISNFTVEFSCKTLTNVNCPTGSLVWTSAAKSPNVITTNGRVSGGSVIIDNITASATAVDYYVRVAATNSSSTSLGTYAAAGQWITLSATTNAAAVNWTAGNGQNGSVSLQTCWGVAALTACSFILVPPNTIGGGGFKSYSLVNVSTAGTLASSLTSDTTAYSWASYTFIVSGFSQAGNFAVGATNNVSGATAVNSGNAAVTLNDTTTNGGAGIAPSAPAFFQRDGTTAGTAFLVVGKGSGSMGWGALRVARGANSGYNSANTATALGTLTWSVNLDGTTATLNAAGTGFTTVPTVNVSGNACANGAYTAVLTGTSFTPGAVTAGTGCTAQPTVGFNAAKGCTGTFSVTTKVLTVTLGAAGTGYSANDVLTLVSSSCTTAPTVTVNTVTAGAVATVTVTTGGVCTAFPTGALATTVAPAGGTGATITVATVGLNTVTVSGAAGCTDQPTFTVPANTGTNCAGGIAVATGTLTATTVASITNTNTGDSCTAAASTCTITGGGGAGATATCALTTPTNTDWQVSGNPTNALGSVVLVNYPSNASTNGANKVIVKVTSNGSNSASATSAALGNTFTATPAVPNAVNVVDITDTGATISFNFANGVQSTNYDYPGASGTTQFALAASVDTPTNTGAANVAATTCTQLSAGTAGTGQAADTASIYNANVYCTITGLVPGRSYNAKGGVTGTSSGTAAAGTLSNALVFITASQRGSAPSRNPSINGASTTLPVTNSYYYATGSGFQLYYQIPGAAAADAVAPGGISSQTFSSYFATVQAASQRPQIGDITTTGVATLGNWNKLTFASKNTNAFDAVITNNQGTASQGSVSYTVQVTFNSSVNMSAADQVTVASSADTSKGPTSAPVPGSAQRRVTDTSVWVEFEAPKDVGNNGGATPYIINKQCSGDNAFVAATSSAAITGSLNANNFMLAAVNALSGTSCSVQVQYASGTGTNSSSSSITVTLAGTGSVPDTPAAPTFDQITTLSFSVSITFPQKLGASAANQNWVVPVAADFGVSTSGSGTAVTNAVPSLDTNAGGAIAAVNGNFQNAGFLWITGYTARFVGYTVTGASTVTNLSALSSYSVSIKVRNNAASNNVSAASSGGAITMTNNGDIPDAPTNVAVSRITSTSVRLSFNRPLNVGGAPLTNSSGTTNQVSTLFRAWARAGTAATYAPATFVSAPAAPANLNTSLQPNLTWTLTWFADINGLTAGTSYVFYLGATNQFSAAITTGTPVGSYDPSDTTVSNLVKISTGTTAITTPTGNPDSPQNLAVSIFSNAYVILTWNEPVSWGTTAVTQYVVSRATGSGTSATFSCSGTAAPAQPTAYAQAITCSDLTVAAATSYTYTVQAQSSTGLSVASTVSQSTDATNAAPGAPAAPRVIQYYDTATALIWAAPQDQGGVATNAPAANFSGYKLIQTFVPATGEAAASQCDLTFTWTAVPAALAYSPVTIPGKAYTYKVAATNQFTATGASSPTKQTGTYSPTTTQVANSIQRPYPTPSLVLSAKGSGYVSFTVSYSFQAGTTTLQTGTSASGIWAQSVGLVVEQQTPGNSTNANNGADFSPDTFWFVASGSLVPTATVVSVNGLLANSVYKFKAAAVNGFKNAEQTTAALTVTTNTAAVVPGSVSTIQSVLLAKRSNSISLVWNSPLETGGKGVPSTYKVGYQTNGAGAFTYNTTQTSSLGSVQFNGLNLGAINNVISGLTANTAYTINVYASNGLEPATGISSTFLAGAAKGNGDSNSVTTGQVPDYPGALTVTVNTQSTITTTWSAPNQGSSAITGYTLQAQSVTTAGVSTSLTAVTVGTTTNVASFVLGGLYRLSISATNTVGTGDYSIPVISQAALATATTIPNQIGTPTLTFFSATEYRLSWTDSSNANTNPASFYLVAFWQVGPRVVATNNVPGNTLQNQNGPLQSQQVGTTIAGNFGSLATCTQIVYVIRPSSQYYVSVAGVDSSNNIGTFSALPGTTSAFKLQMTQGATPGAPASPSLAPAGTGVPSPNPNNTSYGISLTMPTYSGLALPYAFQVTTSPEYGGKQLFGFVPIANSQNTSGRDLVGTCTTSSTSCVFVQNNLQPGTNYVVNVRALNSFGQSIPSQNFRVTTTGGSGFAAQTSFWTLVLLALASVLAFAF